MIAQSIISSNPRVYKLRALSYQHHVNHLIPHELHHANTTNWNSIIFTNVSSHELYHLTNSITSRTLSSHELYHLHRCNHKLGRPFTICVRVYTCQELHLQPYPNNATSRSRCLHRRITNRVGDP